MNKRLPCSWLGIQFGTTVGSVRQFFTLFPSPDMDVSSWSGKL